MRASSGEKKQPHSIDASKCIECGVCGRACPYGAIRDPQGAKPEKVKRSDWPKPYVWNADCVGCEVCVSCCPFQALGMAEVNNEFVAALFDPKACVGCGLCEQGCPVNAIQLFTPQELRKSA
jgi:formate hydrogenlyase subunit 6/NADH:ubiquinone oxidoreductase subunit I